MRKERWFYRATAFVVVAISLILSSQPVRGQAPAYSGPLLYSDPWQTSVPPLYSGQPPQVTTAYLWLDDLMRLDPEYRIEAYLNSLSWNDTAKTIVSNLYRIQDDNPLSYYMWSGNEMHPNPYQGVPGRAELAIIRKVSHIAADTMRSSFLLFSEIISDVIVNDTICVQEHDSLSGATMDMVLANASILDPIKGKRIPSCPDIYKTNHGLKNGTSTLSAPAFAIPVVIDSAMAGTCMQFEYSPEWSKIPSDDMSPRLIDSTGGWWVKPGHEYIVFLYFIGFKGDTSNGYFSTWAGGGGTSGGLYPVVGGIVQDPNDDFGIGAASGLTVSDWKSRLRARINTLINP